jgi:hypothetical protein
VSDLPTWARALLYAAGAIATAVVLYFVIYLAVRAALRAHFTEQREAARRQEDLLRTIATASEYVADVADAWAEGEAERRGSTPAGASSVSSASSMSSAPPDQDHAGAGDGSG